MPSIRGGVPGTPAVTTPLAPLVVGDDTDAVTDRECERRQRRRHLAHRRRGLVEVALATDLFHDWLAPQMRSQRGDQRLGVADAAQQVVQMSARAGTGQLLADAEVQLR